MQKPLEPGREEAVCSYSQKEDTMKKLFFIAAAVGSLAVPAMAEEVGVGVGPVGVGVTVGAGQGYRDYERARDRDRTTVIEEREPVDRTTVIKKEHDDGVETKTIIHHD